MNILLLPPAICFAWPRLFLFSQISPGVLSYLHIVQPCGSRDPMDLFCNDVAKWSHREKGPNQRPVLLRS